MDINQTTDQTEKSDDCYLELEVEDGGYSDTEAFDSISKNISGLLEIQCQTAQTRSHIAAYSYLKEYFNREPLKEHGNFPTTNWLLRKSKKLVNSTAIVAALFLLSILVMDYEIPNNLYPRSMSSENERQLKKSRVGIAILVPNNNEDLKDLCAALYSLSSLPGEANSTRAPVLVFHENNLVSEQKEDILRCTDRMIAFVEIDLKHSFPAGFNPEKEYERSYASAGVSLGRSAWGYVQMIRFWNTLVFENPIVQQYDTIMRLDSDSCFLNEDSPDMALLPTLADHHVYQSIGILRGSSKYISGLYDFAVKYMEKENITPSNPELWERITSMWTSMRTLPVFRTNFEVFRTSFFTRRDVKKWHQAISENEPYGILRNRWGDAQIRVFTLAFFATKEQVMQSSSEGYLHGRGQCREYLHHSLPAELAALKE